MIDRTQEDINQDLRIAALEQNVKELKRQLDGTGRLLADHEGRIKQLDPLRVLIEHVDNIIVFLKSRGF